MQMTELILKKRRGLALSPDEIRWMIEQYTANIIPDYQMSAMLMAICFAGMTREETLCMTLAMRDSGVVMNLAGVDGVRVDKHSTGGVGDKISLILCPMLAECGVKMPMLSGRGLGHTGGTIDKLESFSGFRCEWTDEEVTRLTNRVGLAIASQSDSICPADKKLYALRDVTGTVDCIALIVSSIMSKKLATDADALVLDVKTGRGAFMKTEEDALALAKELTEVGRLAGKRVTALVTDMNQPLGRTVGNALEVRETLAVLKGRNEPDLVELCLALGSELLLACHVCNTEQEARARLLDTLTSGAALERFRLFIQAQGGDAEAVDDESRLPTAPVRREVRSTQDGYVVALDALEIGNLVVRLGGGRAKKDSPVDLSVGLELGKKIGEPVRAGQTLAVIHARTQAEAEAAEKTYLSCCRIGPEPPAPQPLVRTVIRSL